jgi:hypothetical protein
MTLRPGFIESMVAPPWHVLTSTPLHVPATHASASAQAWPQVPQFAGSLLVSEQVPEQATSGAAQVTVQVPDSHTSPAAQTLPHAPQSSLSEPRSRQEPEQSVNPPGHDAVQEPS